MTSLQWYGAPNNALCQQYYYISFLLQEALAGDLSRMADWLKTNHLCMNVRKTKLLLLARRGRAQESGQVRLTANDVEVERQDDVKFLGVTIDSELTWEKHVAAVRRKYFGGLATLRCLRHPCKINACGGLRGS